MLRTYKTLTPKAFGVVRERKNIYLEVPDVILNLEKSFRTPIRNLEMKSIHSEILSQAQNDPLGPE